MRRRAFLKGVSVTPAVGLIPLPFSRTKESVDLKNETLEEALLWAQERGIRLHGIDMLNTKDATYWIGFDEKQKVVFTAPALPKERKGLTLAEAVEATKPLPFRKEDLYGTQKDNQGTA